METRDSDKEAHLSHRENGLSHCHPSVMHSVHHNYYQHCSLVSIHELCVTVHTLATGIKMMLPCWYDRERQDEMQLIHVLLS